MVKFEIIEHTADIAWRVWGADLRELIENAATGFITIVAGPARPEPQSWREIKVRAESPELVLHHSLRELLYLVHDEGLMPVAVTVSEADPHSATLQAGVVRSDSLRAQKGPEIKAITRHLLEIRPHDQGLVVEIVGDV
jgi:SHS2 domain-containing protein